MEKLLERCRTCSDIVDPGVSLLEPSQQRLNKWTVKNLHLQINNTNGFPTMMCMDCIASIRSWMVFLQRCQKSQVLFETEIAKLQENNKLLNVATSNECAQENVENTQTSDVKTSIVEDMTTSEHSNTTVGTESAPSRVQLLRKLRLDPVTNNPVQKSSDETPEPTNESQEQAEKSTIESLKTKYQLKNLKICLHRLKENQIDTKVKSRPCPLSKKADRPHALIKPLPPDGIDISAPSAETPEEVAQQIERVLMEAEEFELVVLDDDDDDERVDDTTSSAQTEKCAPDNAQETNTRNIDVTEKETAMTIEPEKQSTEISIQSTEVADEPQPSEVTKTSTLVEQQSTNPHISLPPSALLQHLPKNQPYCIIPMEHENNTFYVINPMPLPQSNIPQPYNMPGFNPWLPSVGPASNVRPAVPSSTGTLGVESLQPSATSEQAGPSTRKSASTPPDVSHCTTQIQQPTSPISSEESMDFTVDPDAEQGSPSEVESLQSNKETSELHSSSELEKPSKIVTPTDLKKVNPSTLQCLGLTLEDTVNVPSRCSKSSAIPSKTVTLGNGVHGTAAEFSMNHHTVPPTHPAGVTAKSSGFGTSSGRPGREAAKHALEKINKSLTYYEKIADSFRDKVESRQSEFQGIPVASTSTQFMESTPEVRTPRRNPTIDRLVAALNEIFNPDPEDTSPLSPTDVRQSSDRVTSAKALIDTMLRSTNILTSGSSSTEVSNKVNSATAHQQVEGSESRNGDSTHKLKNVLPSSPTVCSLQQNTNNLEFHSQKIQQSPLQNVEKNQNSSVLIIDETVPPEPFNLKGRESSTNVLDKACTSSRLTNIRNPIVNAKQIPAQVAQTKETSDCMNKIGNTEGSTTNEILNKTASTSNPITSLEQSKNTPELELGSCVIDDIEAQLCAMHADSQEVGNVLESVSKVSHKTVASETGGGPVALYSNQTGVPTPDQSPIALRHVTDTTGVEIPSTSTDKSTTDHDIDFEVLLDIPFSREGPSRLDDSDICETDPTQGQKPDVSFSASEKSDSEEEFRSVLHCSKCNAVFYNNKSFVNHYVTHSYASAYEVNKNRSNVKTEAESPVDEIRSSACTPVQHTNKSVDFELSDSPSVFRKQSNECVEKTHKSLKKCKVESESRKEVKDQLLICNFCTKRFGQKSSLESHIFCHLSFTLEPELDTSTEVVECKIVPDFSPSRRFSRSYTRKSSLESPIKVEAEEKKVSRSKSQQTRCKICLQVLSPGVRHKCSLRISARIQASPRRKFIEPKRSRKIATHNTKLKVEPSVSPSKKRKLDLNVTPTKTTTSIKSKKVEGQPNKTTKPSKFLGKNSKPDVTPTKRNINQKSSTTRGTKILKKNETKRQCKDDKSQSPPKKVAAAKNKTTKSTRGSRKN